MAGRELSLIDKLGQRTVQTKIKELIDNNGKTKAPWVIELDPTTACNLACQDCISANLLNQGGFERERLKEIAKEFKIMGIKAVVLIGGGEPMAHPEFGTIVDYFHDNGIHVGVTTNGTLMKRYMPQLKNKTKWVRVSVDAGSEEVYQEFRPHKSGKSQFNTVIDQMSELIKDKKGKVGYSFVILSKKDKDGKILSTNAVDLTKAAKVAKEIGCDYFEVKPAFDIMHFLDDQGDDVVKTARQHLGDIKNLETENFKVITPVTIEDFKKGISTQPKSYNRCLVSELRSCVTPSGTYVCQYHRGTMNMKIGDSNFHTLDKIWNSDRRKHILEKVNPQIHCKFHCIRHESNLLLEEMMKGKKIDKLEDYDFFI